MRSVYGIMYNILLLRSALIQEPSLVRDMTAAPFVHPLTIKLRISIDMPCNCSSHNACSWTSLNTDLVIQSEPISRTLNRPLGTVG